MFPIFFFAICGLTSAQQLINLNQLNGNSDLNIILATGNASIYITASSDPPTYLKSIIFSTDIVNKTAYEVMSSSRLYRNSDLLQPWIVKGPVTVTTSLTAEQISALTGSIYITTAKQAYNKNFLVYDLTMEQTISTSDAQSIIVILNSQYSRVPYISSYFSSWVQSSSQQVYMFRGFPADIAENGDSAIFSNPFPTTNSIAQTANVENFDVNLPIFYFEVYGGVSFKVSTLYVNIAGGALSHAVTTGFYMKAEISTEVDIQLHPMTEQTSNKIGVNYIGDNILADGTVSVGIRTSDGFSIANEFHGSTESYWQTNVGNPLTIKSSGTTGAQFYLQYYTIQGDAPSTNITTMAPNGGVTTSRPILTTTQSSKSAHFVLSVMCSFLGYRIML